LDGELRQEARFRLVLRILAGSLVAFSLLGFVCGIGQIKGSFLGEFDGHLFLGVVLLSICGIGSIGLETSQLGEVCGHLLIIVLYSLVFDFATREGSNLFQTDIKFNLCRFKIHAEYSGRTSVSQYGIGGNYHLYCSWNHLPSIF